MKIFVRLKRLHSDFARLKEMTQLKEICREWVAKDDQLADTLTEVGETSKKLVDVIQASYLPIAVR